MLTRFRSALVEIHQRHFASIKKLIDYSKVPELNESELEEQQIKGSGPGGQKINKTSSCVFLRHIPTDLNVRQKSPLILSLKRQFSSIKQQIDYSNVPELNDKEIEEQNIKGSGPGGSKIATTCSCLLLKHIPTGIVVKCQETRFLEKNRKRARELLVKKLDNHFNGENSVEAQIKRLQDKRRKSEESKRDKLRQMKEKWNEQNNLDPSSKL
ncbi:mitochondrial translation release factor in rescue [Anthonomus grandis grandis]|uniref:mitochondrial translation release factor in rescue n=1 Tax=Anthonomus grandis grandis TaxID=2921223 RepID=UPI0021663E7C|nr:mitochondrial translation release factor in rescue [Anthonomus grandis grandis]